MLFAGLGAALYALTQMIRYFRCPPATPVASALFLVPLVLCLLADALVAYGSIELLRRNSVGTADYMPVITVISLLTAGVIAGRFSITHQDAGDDERLLVLLVRGGFTPCGGTGLHQEVFREPRTTA